MYTVIWYITIIMLSVVATVDFEQSTYSVHELYGSVQPVIVFSNPLSSDVTIQVSGEYISVVGVF